MADDNPHIGGSLPEIEAAVRRTEQLTSKFNETISKAEQRAQRMTKRLSDLEARLERNAARAQPYRAVQTSTGTPQGSVVKVRGYGATPEEAQAAAASSEPLVRRGRGGKPLGVQPSATVVTQANPHFEEDWSKELRKEINAQRQAMERLNAEIRGEATVRQKIADQALTNGKVEKAASDKVVSAQVEKARATRAAAEAQQREALALAAQSQYANRGGILVGKDQTAQMPKSPMVPPVPQRMFSAAPAPSSIAHPDKGAFTGGYSPGLRTLADIDAEAKAQASAVPAANKAATATTAVAKAKGQSAAASKAQASADAAAARSQQSLTNSAASGRALWTRNTAAIAGNSDALRRHGALTTEFISAAARGEASYREWGYQIGATAGKFAGWTAVSIPVFAAIAGVTKIGKGAIDSADGVNQLQRVMDHVNSDDAQQAFRNLSREFNVAPDVAARAVYLAGQRFHNLKDAVDAASASLFAFKTGELDIDTAAQGLNSVASAFGLGGADVAKTFDQINQAQNQLSANIPDMVSGLAKAGGAFRNAGGDPQALITLLTAARLAAGRTGTQAATAIQRSAGYVGRPSNQAALRGFGIDPTQAYYSSNGPSIIGQAVGVTKNLLNRPGGEADIEKLAAAISSPQFASMFVPILRAAAEGRTANQGNINAISPIVSPEASRGSAAQELKTLLRSPKEQFAAFGNELQRLGSALGESGLTAAVSRLTLGMTGMVAVTERTLGVLGHVPAVLQEITFLGAGIAAARGAGRFFGVGEGTGGVRNAVFGRSDEQNAKRAVRTALKDQQEYIRTESVGVASRIQRSGLIQESTARQLSEAQRLGPHSGENQAAFGARIGTLNERNLAAQAAAEAATLDRRVLDQLAKDQLRLAAAYKEAARTGAVLSLATRERIYAPPTQDRPAYGQNPVIPGGREGPTGRPADVLRHIDTYSSREGLLKASQNEELALAQRMEASRAAFRESEGVSQKLGAAANTAGVAASGAGKSLARVGSGLAASARGLYGMIGGFGLAIIGIDAAVAAGQAIKNHEEKLGERANALGKSAKDQQAAQARIDAAKALLPHGFDDIHRGAYSDKQLSVIDAGKYEYDKQQINARLGAEGKPIVNARADEIKSALATDLQRVGADRTKSLQALLVSLNASAEDSITEGFKSWARAAIGSAMRSGDRQTGSLIGKLFSNLNNVDLKGLGKDLDSMADFIATGHAKLADVQEYYGNAIAQLAAGAPGPNASYHQRIAYEARLDQFVKTVEGGPRAELTQALGTAVSQKARDRAYSRYYEESGKADDTAQKALKENADHRTSLQKKLAEVNKKIGPYADPTVTPLLSPDVTQADQGPVLGTGAEQGALRARRDKLMESLKASGANRAKIQETIRLTNKRLKGLNDEIRRQQALEHDTDAETQAQIASFGVASGLPRDLLLLKSFGERLTALKKAHLGNGAQALALIQQQKAQDEQIAQDRLNEIQTNSDLYASQTSDPDEAARRNISGLEQQLAAMRANPTQTGGVNAQKQKQTQINQARNDLAQQQKQQVDDLVAAQFAYRESLTTDPVAIARLEYLKANAVVKRGGFKGQAERLNALAQRNTALQAYRDAQSQSKASDIDFELNMDKITVQDAIDKYNTLLKSHNLSKETRQAYQMKVKDLKAQAEGDSTSFDLDVGSIKMPTIYDVRKAFDPIRKSVKAARDAVPDLASMGPQQTTGDALLAGRKGAAMAAPSMAGHTFNITVNDPNAAGEVYHNIDRALKTHVRAKLKSRGHR